MEINTTKTELALKAVSTEIDAFIIDAKAEVEALQAEYANLVPVADTNQGYEHCKQVRKDLMPIKTKLETARKTLKAPILDAGKLVDSTLKPLIEAVDALYRPFEAAYRAVDEEKKNREANRQAKIEAGFNQMDQALVSAAGSTSTVVQAMLDEMADFSIDSKTFMEKSDQAAVRHGEVMQKLSEMLLQAIKSEEVESKQAEMEARLSEMEKREAELNAKEAALSPEASVEQLQEVIIDNIQNEKALMIDGVNMLVMEVSKGDDLTWQQIQIVVDIANKVASDIRDL